MEVQISPPDGNLRRGPGRPPRQIPAPIAELARATYRTGKVGRVQIGADEEEEATELRRTLETYARQLGRRMRVRRVDDVMFFEMVDVRRRRAVDG
jgi:hypothetical protein